jgi:hydroxyacylglutathione hydrolase
MLEIIRMVQGPVQTNCYLIADSESGQAVVIDPAWSGAQIAGHARQRGWTIGGVWLTHAHFDHMGGISDLADPAQGGFPPVALHPDDLPLWEAKGGAPLFGFELDPGPRPSLSLAQGLLLQVGRYPFEVRHAPGHTPGHVVFHCAEVGVVFCGDVIFEGSIGRTDLPGGSYEVLLQSIHTQILSLPDETRLLSGHGPETTVGAERRENPFLSV